MVSLLKGLLEKLLGKREPSLMEKAIDNVIENGYIPNALFTGSLLDLFHDGHNNDDALEQLIYDQQITDQHQQFVDQHMQDMQYFNDMNQMHQDQQFMDNMNDPYLNPGQDQVIDESYHGIDHHDFHDSGHNDHF